MTYPNICYIYFLHILSTLLWNDPNHRCAT